MITPAGATMLISPFPRKLEEAMKTTLRSSLLRPLHLLIASACLASLAAYGQSGELADPADEPLPNPAPSVIKEWVTLPDDRQWGSTAGVDIGPEGQIWAYDRCGGIALAGGCEDSLVDPILKIDRFSGEVLMSFGAGLFVRPHGIHVDGEGNVWVTDSLGNETGTKGHQVFKFSPRGEVLMTLGTAGQPGNGPGQLNGPCDVHVAPNGDIFVADGHDGQNDTPPDGATGRILKFDSEGNFLMEWGEIGSGEGQFRTPHALEMDSQGRLFVADRGNHRIEIFDQQGNRLDSYYQFGRVSGLFIDDEDNLYAIDSESNPARNPGWRTGIRIGHASRDQVTSFVPPHYALDGRWEGAMGEGVAVDPEGNILVAEGPVSRPVAGSGLTRFVARGNSPWQRGEP